MANVGTYDPNSNVLDNTNKQIASTQAEIQASPTYGGDTPPTSGDLALDAKLTSENAAARTELAKKMNADWYGPANTSTDPGGATPENQGALSTLFTNLQKPLYAVTGAIDYGLGKSGKSDIVSAVNQNMNIGHKDVGDLLREEGSNGWWNAPLGFMGDVALDPVQWATAGTESLIPRIGAGLVKGTMEGGVKAGLEGGYRGLTSGLGRTALDVGDLASGVNRTIGKIPMVGGLISAPGRGLGYLADKASSKLFGEGENLSSKVFGQSERYQAITGIDPLANINKNIIGLGSSNAGVDEFGHNIPGPTLGNVVTNLASKVFGENNVAKFLYSPSNDLKIIKLKNKVLALMEKTSDLSQVEAKIPDLLKNQPEFSPPFSPGTSPEKMALENRMADGLDDSSFIAQNNSKINDLQADNSLDFFQRMEVEAEKEGISKADLAKSYKLQQQLTGIDWYDQMNQKFGLSKTTMSPEWLEEQGITPSKYNLKDWTPAGIKVGENLIKSLDFAKGFFKTAKVVLNPAAHVTAFMGEATMSSMFGLNLQRMMEGLPKTWDWLNGKSLPDWVTESFLNETSNYVKFASENPDAIKTVLGFNPSFVGGKYFIDNLIADAKATGVMSPEAVRAAMTRMPQEVQAAMEKLRDAKSVEERATAQIGLRQAKGKAKIPSPFMNTEEKMISSNDPLSDLNLEGVNNVIKNLAAQNGPMGDFYKLVQGQIDKWSSNYSKVHQVWKVRSAIYMTKEGLTADEMLKAARMTPGGITQGDIVGNGMWNGQKTYKLTWDKATDIANEVYVNYAAMPAFVRMMRSASFIGAPFLSFSYAMLPKTLKTLYHNPAFFNKVSFLMKEIGGPKSPEEKAYLKSKYGAWFDDPGVMKVPFTNDAYPAYVSLTKYLPYYTLSSLNPSVRAYTDPLPNSIVQIMDKGQLFKDPVGATFFNYVVLPHLLSQNDRALGEMGQPLYPLNATGIQKAGYAARDLTEAYVPGALGAAGFLGGAVAPGLTQYVPSYSYRQSAEAVQGNNSLGIPSSDTPAQLEGKALAAFGSVRYNNMKLNVLKNQKKKSKTP